MGEVKFIPKTHTYVLGNGKRVPSVTQILAPISKVLYQNINEPTLRAKAKIGSSVHQLIEYYSKYEVSPPMDTDERVLKYFAEYLEWNNTLKDSYILENEFKGYYDDGNIKFAGTIDNIRMIGNDLCLIDYKTVANPNIVNIGLQLYGYKLIAEQTLDININKFYALSLQQDSYDLIDLTTFVNDKTTKEFYDTLYKMNRLLEFHGIIQDGKDYGEEDL